MRSKTKYKFSTLLLVLLLLFLTLGYAYLNQSLNINGNSILNNASWNVYWDNVQVTTGSVESSTPTIDSNKTTVTFSVHLSKPGDFYEFTVDAKNDGTIDAMIESISSTLNNNPITTLPNYLYYSITYSDDRTIEANHLLKANDKEIYKVRVEYKLDISPEDLPTTNQTLNFAFQLNCIQGSIGSLSKNVELGDYVSYTPEITNYTIDRSCTGASNDRNINPSELNLWRVIKKKRDGSLELISEYNSSTSVVFYGKVGYSNFTGCLNLIASKYETEGITTGSRNFGFKGQTEYITDQSKLRSNNAWRCSTGEACAPEQEEYLGGGDFLYLDDYNLVNNVLGTIYTPKINNRISSYWTSSRHYFFDNYSNIEQYWFGISIGTSGEPTVMIRYIYSEGTSQQTTGSIGVRPIIIINKNVNISSGTGTKDNPFVIVKS